MCRHKTDSSPVLSAFLCLQNSQVTVKWLNEQTNKQKEKPLSSENEQVQELQWNLIKKSRKKRMKDLQKAWELRLQEKLASSK